MMKKRSILNVFVMTLYLLLATTVMAHPQDSAQDNTQSAPTDSRKMQAQVASGQKVKIQGTILKRDDDTFVVRDAAGNETTVRLVDNTKIEEKKSNPFRGAKKYSAADVMRVLFVEVEGHGDVSVEISADKIKFLSEAQWTAVSINPMVVQVGNRVGEAETQLTKAQTRLTAAEQNTQRLSGQVEELSQVTDLAKGSAVAVQQTADQAVEGVNRTNDRINSLNDYEEMRRS